MKDVFEKDWIEKVLDENAVLRLSNRRLREFVERLIDPEGLGWSVMPEVRRAAKQILGEKV